MLVPKTESASNLPCIACTYSIRMYIMMMQACMYVCSYIFNMPEIISGEITGAICKTPVPCDVSEFKSYLGLLSCVLWEVLT